MIGVWAVWRRLRIIEAVSNPSMSGMWTSSRMSANSRSSKKRSASRPERAVTMFWPRPLENGLINQQFFGQVVHHEDVDLLVIGHSVATVRGGGV